VCFADQRYWPRFTATVSRLRTQFSYAGNTPCRVYRSRCCIVRPREPHRRRLFVVFARTIRIGFQRIRPAILSVDRVTIVDHRRRHMDHFQVRFAWGMLRGPFAARTGST
jgi:hypothetical protein